MKTKYNRNMTVSEVRHYASARLLEADLDDVYNVIDRILDQVDVQIEEEVDAAYDRGYVSGLADCESEDKQRY